MYMYVSLVCDNNTIRTMREHWIQFSLSKDFSDSQPPSIILIGFGFHNHISNTVWLRAMALLMCSFDFFTSLLLMSRFNIAFTHIFSLYIYIYINVIERFRWINNIVSFKVTPLI